MSFLSAGNKNSTQQPVYTGLQLQTSINTLPIPYVKGRARVAPNVIWYGNFKKSSVKQSAGKGLFGGGSSTEYYYYADVILGLCEGVVASIGQVWKDSTIYSGLSALGLSLATGTTPQAGWPYLESFAPNQYLTYPGTAYVYATQYSLGTSASLSSHNFEAITPEAGSGANGVDADPAGLVYDFLTNFNYGANFPAASINAATIYSSAAASTTGDSAYQTYCRAQGICFSPAITSVETAQSVLTRWMQLSNTACVWSGGLLNFIPYGDETITANGVTYLPDMTPIFNLGDDDYQGDASDDPLKCQISDITEAYNVERLTIYDRANSYDATPVEARDEAAVNSYGLRIDTSISAYEICDMNVAAIIAQLILQRGLYVRNTYRFKLDWRYCGLDPMDLVTLTDAAMGMSQVLVRLTSIEEDDQATLTVTAEELPLGVGTAALYAKQENQNTSAQTFATANPVNPPVIFEPPPAMTGGEAQVWIYASGSVGGVADPSWGGCEVYASIDDATYEYIGTITAPARQGALLAPLSGYSGANPDNTDTLSVDLTMSGGTLMSAASAAAAANGSTQCYVDGEIISFLTATLTSNEQYALNALYRGQNGTAAGSHAAGAQFCRLDGSGLIFDLPSAWVGVEIYVKLASFNQFGGGLQLLSACEAYTYVPQGSGNVGPVTQALAAHQVLDFGLTNAPVMISDDFGSTSDPIVYVVDLGTI